jgi:hypothetical protein
VCEELIICLLFSLSPGVEDGRGESPQQQQQQQQQSSLERREWKGFGGAADYISSGWNGA